MADRTRRVVWTDSARGGLGEVLDYIGEDSPMAAARFLEGVLEKAQSLSFPTERGRIVPELDQPDIREVFVSNYRMLYRVAELEVYIVAFLHGARDFSKWINEKRSG